MKKENKTQLKLKKLEDIFKHNGTLLIVMQDNPDPDSIAAAAALKRLANVMGDIKCSITHGGTVGRGENRSLVRYLDLNLHQYSLVDITNFDITGMVDTQPGTGNNALPEDIMPDIVFDHHPLKSLTRSAMFFDVRSKYGATATILLEYLQEAKIEIEMPLATALLYAIRSDTQDLGREAIINDIKAIEVLFPIANKRMLSEIQRGSVPREYFIVLAQALQNARVYGNIIVTNLGTVDNPDMISEVADLLLRGDEIVWTMCTGKFEDKLLVSVRTKDSNNRADKVIKRVVGRKGTGGGHITYAGGQIPIGNDNNWKINRLKDKISKKFLEITGSDKSQGEKLVK